MYKKIIWTIVILIILVLSGYLKFGYPGSQWQLEKEFKFVESMPAEHYYNASEKSCGIVHKRVIDGRVEKNSENAGVLKCFQKAFDKCEARNIFMVKDEGEIEKKITYALIKIIKKNDQHECLIQNYFEEQDLTLPQDVQPISYVNTCTVYKGGDEAFNSCEPLYVKEEREKRVEIKNQQKK